MGSLVSGITKMNTISLDALKRKYNFHVPDRGDLDDESITWRDGKPDYSLANLTYMMGKTQNHEEGSFEMVVEDLVKKWEMQASHYLNFKQWSTVEHGDYMVKVNQDEELDGEKAYEMGNYNFLLKSCPAYQKLGQKTFDESHKLFRDAFPDGFPWEVLKVASERGPSGVVVVCAWRHWANFKGKYGGNEGNGELVEMFGLLKCKLSDQNKIRKIEVLYDPETFLKVMEGELTPNNLRGGKAIVEDTATLLKMMRSELEPEDLRGGEADTAETAIEKIEKAAA